MREVVIDTVYDTDYTDIIDHGGYRVVDRSKVDTPDNRSWFERTVDLFVSVRKSDWVTKEDKKKTLEQNDSLEEQLKKIITLPDEDYDDSKVWPKLRKYITQLEWEYVKTMTDYRSHIAPSFWEVKWSHFQVSSMVAKTYYANNYPSYIDFLWTRDVMSFYGKWDMSWFIYPSDDSAMQAMLKKRYTQLKSEINGAWSAWRTYDADVDIEFRDVNEIRQKLATRQERYYESGFYATIYEHDEEKLREESKKFEQKISGYGIWVKPATRRMDEAHTATLPLAIDNLGIQRSMVTTSLAGSFPFISNDVIDNSWIMYGLNLHSWSLVIFNRFAKKLPNANSVILATSWAGKSFATKLEILRYLFLGVETIVIDPENEYKELTEKVWGTYINISVNSDQFINPFDIPPSIDDVEYGPGDLLRSQILNLIGLIDVLIEWLTSEEEALLDKALQATYALQEITVEMSDYSGKTPPLMQDLLNVLEGMEWGEHVAIRLSKYVTGTFAKLFNNYTTIKLDSTLTVFSIRDIEDALKTPAMYNVLNYIRTKVRAHKRKRLLVIDEAWIMMQQKLASEFLYQLVKRARKYGLGVTTITQDVEDFITSPHGKPIVSNAAMQLLLKQSTSSIKSLEKVFGLSEAEKQQLVASNIWEWVLFAWAQHVAVKILASPEEKAFISTDIA